MAYQPVPYVFFKELQGFKVGQRVRINPYSDLVLVGVIQKIREDGFAYVLIESQETRDENVQKMVGAVSVEHIETLEILTSS